MLHTLLPQDAPQALLIGRLWVPGLGPVVCAVTPSEVLDLSGLAPTCSQLLEQPQVATQVRAYLNAAKAPHLTSTAQALANSDEMQRKADQPWFLAPCDLQAVKAAGVTFVDTLTDSALNLKSKFPDIAEKVVPFAITERIPNDGVQFTKDLSPALKTKITDALIKMSKDPAGAKSLKDLYTIDGFEVAGYDKYYKPFEDVLAKAGVNAEDYVGKPK